MQLVPNVIERPAEVLENILKSHYPAEMYDAFFSAPATESIIKGVNVNIQNIQILDNHSGFITSKIQIFDIDSYVYPIVMVITNDTKEPVKFEFKSVFNGIGDGDELAIGDNLTIYREYDNPPKFIDIHILLMKSNEKSRDIYSKINEVMNSKEGKDTMDSISKIITASNPAYTVIANLGQTLLQSIINYLSNEKDEQIFYGVKSMNMYPDNLGIGKQHILTDNENAKIIFEVQGF
jgi:hypothetical protein